MKILITGGTGFVGTELGLELVRRGHSLVVISRNKSSAKMSCPYPCEIVEGDLAEGPLSSSALSGVEAVIHLMGEPVAQGRWTEKKKKSLVNSRVAATKNLRKSLTSPVKVLVSASAIGYYGDRGEEKLSEGSSPGAGFLADLCSAWEKEAFGFSAGGTRVAIARIGIVLGREGGALAEMVPLFRAGLGGPIAGGGAWMSWIHRDDLISSLLFALENKEVNGIFNAVAPEPCTNRNFTRELAAALGCSAIVPVPGFALSAAFGEKSSVLKASQRVLPEVLQKNGFIYKFPNLQSALTEELSSAREKEELLVVKQYVPKAPAELFPFFAEAGNLGELTPSSLHFRILSVEPEPVGGGTLIRYALKIHGFPVRWLTRIEKWNPPHEFVDNQLKGPYNLWHHTHLFEPLGAGTLMTDTVRYRLPMGGLGRFFGGAFVRSDVENIFKYRRERIESLFGGRE